MGIGVLGLAAGFAAGAILGSFLGVLFVRLPLARGFVSGRSSCDACGRALTTAELVPLLSFLWLRGRCWSCGAPIDRALFVVELCAGLLGALIVFRASAPVELVAVFFFFPLLLLGALDFRHHWLPVPLVFGLAAAGVAAVLLTGGDIVNSAIGGVLGFAMLEVIRIGYRALRGRDGMGGGDPRLFGAIGIWTGWQALPFILVGASIAGLLLALAMRAGGQAVSAETRVPLGTCLAASTIAVWLVAAIEPFVSFAAL